MRVGGIFYLTKKQNKLDDFINLTGSRTMAAAVKSTSQLKSVFELFFPDKGKYERMAL
jgi:hypothetical protein